MRLPNRFVTWCNAGHLRDHRGRLSPNCAIKAPRLNAQGDSGFIFIAKPKHFMVELKNG